MRRGMRDSLFVMCWGWNRKCDGKEGGVRREMRGVIGKGMGKREG
jgi:hypothetical protein